MLLGMSDVKEPADAEGFLPNWTSRERILSQEQKQQHAIPAKRGRHFNMGVVFMGASTSVPKSVDLVDLPPIFFCGAAIGGFVLGGKPEFQGFMNLGVC